MSAHGDLLKWIKCGWMSRDLQNPNTRPFVDGKWRFIAGKNHGKTMGKWRFTRPGKHTKSY